MAITREDIIKAAETLEKNGVNPTMAAVRDHLGGGSFATISPVLRGWKESRKVAQAVVLEMPGELKTVLDNLGAEFWGTASRLSNQKLATVQAEAETSVTAAEEERDEAINDILRLEEALSDSKQAQEKAHHDCANLEAHNLDLKEQLIRLEEKLAHCHTEAEQLRADLRKATSDKERNADEASRLLALNQELKRERDEALKQVKTVSSELMAAENNARHYMSKAADLSAANDELEATGETQQAELLKLKTTVSGLEARIDDRNIKVEQLEKEIGELREAQKQAVTVQANFDSSQARVRELATEVGELKQENKVLTVQTGELQGRLQMFEQNKPQH